MDVVGELVTVIEVGGVVGTLVGVPVGEIDVGFMVVGA